VTAQANGIISHNIYKRHASRNDANLIIPDLPSTGKVASFPAAVHWPPIYARSRSRLGSVRNSLALWLEVVAMAAM
jgi:hypothetical protein